MINQLFVVLLSFALGLAIPEAAWAQASPTSGTPTLKFLFYRSLAPDSNDKQVLSVTKPFMDLLGDKVGVPIVMEIEKNGRSEELFAMGAKFKARTIHAGIAWGVEFGWLAQKFPELEPLAVVTNGERNPWFSQIMVSASNTSTSLAQLKGKRLARFTHASLMDRLVMDAMLRKEGFDPQDFFLELPRPYADARQALRAVKIGEADCVIVEHMTFSRLEAAQPNLAKTIRIFKESAPYPPPVVFGNPEVINQFKSGLWRQLQAEVSKLHETAEGQQLLTTLRFDTLTKPDKEFVALAKKSALEFSIDRLANLK